MSEQNFDKKVSRKSAHWAGLKTLAKHMTHIANYKDTGNNF